MNHDPVIKALSHQVAFSQRCKIIVIAEGSQEKFGKKMYNFSILHVDIINRKITYTQEAEICHQCVYTVIIYVRSSRVETELSWRCLRPCGAVTATPLRFDSYSNKLTAKEGIFFRK